MLWNRPTDPPSPPENDDLHEYLVSPPQGQVPASAPSRSRVAVIAQSLAHMMWAAMERVLPRLGSAIVMVAFASFTDPHAVGVYTWVALAYTFYQAVAELVLRQQAITSLPSATDTAYVRRLSHRAAAFGSLFIVLTLVALWFALEPSSHPQLLLLVPFAVVPFITTRSVVAVAKMQYAHLWRVLARYQLVAALVALALSFSTVWLTHSALAMSVHVVATEATFLILCLRHARSIEVETGRESRNPRGETMGLSALGGLAWSQGQLERVFIGGLAGNAALGLYSTASTMGRSPGEALSMATANYLRATVAATTDEAAHAASVRKIGVLAVGASVAAVLGTIALVFVVIDPILGADWDATLHAVPVLAVATMPYAVSVCLQTMAVYYKRRSAAIIPAVLGIACAWPIGFMAMSSITSAAYLVVAKELLILLLTFVLAKVPGARLPVLASTLVTGVAVGFALLLL